MRVAIHARVSTFDQQPENQLLALRRYSSAAPETERLSTRALP